MPLNSVLGLWYIRAGVMVLSAIVLFLPRISKRFELDHKNGLAGLERASQLSFSAQMVSQVSLARSSLIKQMNWFGKHTTTPGGPTANNSIDDLSIMGKLDFENNRKTHQPSSHSQSHGFGGKVSPLDMLPDGTMILAHHGKSRQSTTSCLSPSSSSPGSTSQTAMEINMTPRTRQQQLSAGRPGSASWPAILVVPGENRTGDVTSPGTSIQPLDGGNRSGSPRPAVSQAVMPEVETQIEDSDPDEM